MIQRKKLSISKKFISLFILFSMFSSQVFAFIEDDFVNCTLDKNLKIKPRVYSFIEDDFVNCTLDKNLKIKPRVYSFIEDDFVENSKNKSFKKKKVVIEEVLPTHKSSFSRKVFEICEFDNSTPIFIKIKNNITTKQKPQEGEIIEFEAVKKFKIKNKIYPEGTVIKARVENVSPNYTIGTPADIVIGNFQIEGEALRGEISKTGANRALWVKPISYIGTFFFGAGAFLLFIRGGHAKINQNEVFTVYY